jgi:hypothetical protein
MATSLPGNFPFAPGTLRRTEGANGLATNLPGIIPPALLLMQLL